MHLTFKEYVAIEEALEICKKLDESPLEEGMMPDFGVKKLIDGYKAALKARADQKQAEILAKLKAEHEKRKALRKNDAVKKPGEITSQDIEDALSPEDRKALAKMDRASGTRGTIGTA